MFPFLKKRTPEPVIRARKEHNVSRKDIPPEALKVLYRLSDNGFISYLVGGGVRDLLLGRAPKDFDVATDARPRQIRDLFPHNAHLIGRRFRLALICFRERQIETCTFRREPDPSEVEDDGRPGGLYRSEDNLFGTPEQDAQRRDFTVNGLFYDIKTFAIIDYVGGLEDLKRKVLRCIGDPNVRFREDPVRMMRAVRFAAKLGFTIHRDSEKAILRHHAEINNASPPRLFEEVSRLFSAGAEQAFRRLHELRLMGDLLPALQTYLEKSGGKRSPLWKLLATFDAASTPLSEDLALRFATLLYPLYTDHVEKARTLEPNASMEDIASELVHEVLVKPFAARTWCPPRNLCQDIAQILAAQTRYDTGATPPRSTRILNREWFPASILLYRLRMESAQADLSNVKAWEAFAKHSLSSEKRHSSDEVFLAGRLPRHGGDKPERDGNAPRRPSKRRRRLNRGGRHGSFPAQENPNP